MKELFKHWQSENAELLRADIRGTEYPSVDVKTAAEKAKQLVGIKSPDSTEYIIPLFATDKPVLTNEYILYRPNSESIGWLNNGHGDSGEVRFLSVNDVETKEIGHRLRFWLPSNPINVKQLFKESKLPAEKIPPTNRLDDEKQNKFFKDLRRFVCNERKAKLKSNWDIYHELTLKEAIDQNCVSGPFLSIEERYSKGNQTSYTYQIVAGDENYIYHMPNDMPENPAKIDLYDDEGIFENNIYLADTHKHDKQFPIKVKVISVDGARISIEPKWETIDNQEIVKKLLACDKTTIWLHDLLNPVPFDRQLTAIQEVKQNKEKQELITGNRTLNFDINQYAIPETEIDLNEHQEIALIWANSASDVVCIHGPPGTGKTRTLNAYVRQAVAKGLSVLVTAHSNQAVDNLLVGDSTRRNLEEDTLHAMAQDPDQNLSIARVGSNSRNQVVQDSYIDQCPKNADIVAATTSGASQFDQNEFDVAVVDEATQASRPATAIVLNCAQKLVLAGDHRQLPPYCADETMQKEDMHISLFEYLLERYGDDISILLEKQYRMNEEIAEFPNNVFYDGNLTTADRCRDWTVGDLKPIIGIDIDGDEKRQSQGNSIYNIREAEAVAKQVMRLARAGVDLGDIGVITAYNGQVGKIIAHVNQLDIEDPRRVDIDTVDSFQGGEREAIIVSFVRSNPDGYSGFLEFPEEGPRRLNVAVTRARKRLVLIGNWDTLGKIPPHRSSEESCAHLYADLADHLKSTGRMLSLKTTK